MTQLAQRNAPTSAPIPAHTGPAGAPGPHHPLHATPPVAARHAHATAVTPITARDLPNAARMSSTQRRRAFKSLTFSPASNAATTKSQTVASVSLINSVVHATRHQSATSLSPKNPMLFNSAMNPRSGRHGPMLESDAKMVPAKSNVVSSKRVHFRVVPLFGLLSTSKFVTSQCQQSGLSTWL